MTLEGPGDFSHRLNDVVTDPLERVELGERHPKVLAWLQARLAQWMNQNPQFVTEKKQIVLDRAEAKKLRSLGYLR